MSWILQTYIVIHHFNCVRGGAVALITWVDFNMNAWVADRIFNNDTSSCASSEFPCKQRIALTLVRSCGLTGMSISWPHLAQPQPLQSSHRILDFHLQDIFAKIIFQILLWYSMLSAAQKPNNFQTFFFNLEDNIFLLPLKCLCLDKYTFFILSKCRDPSVVIFSTLFIESTHRSQAHRARYVNKLTQATVC